MLVATGTAIFVAKIFKSAKFALPKNVRFLLSTDAVAPAQKTNGISSEKSILYSKNSKISKNSEVQKMF